jgi:hypothetical protein
MKTKKAVKKGRAKRVKRSPKNVEAKAEKAAQRDILSADKFEGLLAIRETWAQYPNAFAKSAKSYLKQLNKRIEKHTSAFSLATVKG